MFCFFISGFYNRAVQRFNKQIGGFYVQQRLGKISGILAVKKRNYANLH